MTAAWDETDYLQVESELKNSHLRNQIFTLFLLSILVLASQLFFCCDIEDISF